MATYFNDPTKQREGTVRRFGGAPYGWLTTDEGDVFLHIRQGCQLRLLGGQIIWLEPKSPMRPPTAGEIVTFVPVHNPGQAYPMAEKWVYTAELEALIERSKQPLYRLMRTTIDANGRKIGSRRMVWEGKDLDDPKLTELWSRYDPQMGITLVGGGGLTLLTFQFLENEEWKDYLFGDPRQK